MSSERVWTVLDLLRWETLRGMALLGRTRLDQIDSTILR